MKPIVICIILSFGLQAAADISCNEKIADANEKYYNCTGQYSDDFTYWLMKYLDYGDFNSTNLDEVAVKSNEICEHFALHVKCVKIELTAIGENCFTEYAFNEQLIEFKRQLLNYFCADEGKKLQDLLANNGYTHIKSGDLSICMAPIDGTKLLIKLDNTPTMGPFDARYVCSFLNEVFTCLKTSVETAQNKNLKNIFQDVFTIIYNMLECSNY